MNGRIKILPKFLQSKRLENAGNKNSHNRIKIFSGTANTALSQVIFLLCSTYAFRPFMNFICVRRSSCHKSNFCG